MMTTTTKLSEQIRKRLAMFSISPEDRELVSKVEALEAENKKMEKDLTTALQHMGKLQGIEAELETRLREAEKAIMHQRNVAYVVYSKPGKGASGMYWATGAREACSNIEKALRGADPAKFDPVALLKSLNGEDLHALLEATALITDPLGQFLIKKAAEEPTSCGDYPGVVLGALDACPKGYKECWKTQTPLPALKTEANGE